MVYATLGLLGVAERVGGVVTLVLVIAFVWVDAVLLGSGEGEGEGEGKVSERMLLRGATVALALMVIGLCASALGADTAGALTALTGMILLFVVVPVGAFFVR